MDEEKGVKTMYPEEPEKENTCIGEQDDVVQLVQTFVQPQANNIHVNKDEGISEYRAKVAIILSFVVFLGMFGYILFGGSVIMFMSFRKMNSECQPIPNLFTDAGYVARSVSDDVNAYNKPFFQIIPANGRSVNDYISFLKNRIMCRPPQRWWENNGWHSYSWSCVYADPNAIPHRFSYNDVVDQIILDYSSVQCNEPLRVPQTSIWTQVCISNSCDLLNGGCLHSSIAPPNCTIVKENAEYNILCDLPISN